jgi:hypothetical protein
LAEGLFRASTRLQEIPSKLRNASRSVLPTS